jgi:hypothetical protein
MELERQIRQSQSACYCYQDQKEPNHQPREHGSNTNVAHDVLWSSTPGRIPCYGSHVGCHLPILWFSAFKTNCFIQYGNSE